MTMMFNSGSIRCVLFDLDNTLVHRSQSIFSYARQFIDDFGSSLELFSIENIAKLIEIQDNGGYLSLESKYSSIKDAVAAILVRDLQWKNDKVTQDEIRTHWSTYLAKHAVEMDGAEVLISSLTNQGYKIGIVSNGSESSRLNTVASLSFRNHMTFLLSSEPAGIRKPDLGIFKKAAYELGFSTAECIFVGDHPINDIVGAESAGMISIWLNGFHPWPGNLNTPTFIANSLSEVGIQLEKIKEHAR